MKAFLYLTLAILCEVFGSVMLNLSGGFTNVFPSIGVVIAYLLSFTFLGLALNYIALSSAYAIWAGLGTALTAIAGVFIFHEQMNMFKGFGLTFIIIGVALLNASANREEQRAIASANNADKSHSF